MSVVECKSLVKKFGSSVAVDHVNVKIEDGEFMVFVGPSGCGKTTTLRMVGGLESVTAGDIFVDGQLINSVAPRNRDMAMVFQNYALYPHFKVFDNIAYPLKLRKRPKAEIKRRVEETGTMLGIGHLLDRLPRQLSGGERQRVALGRAVIRNPRLFLMDEPLSNLDAKLRVQMRREIIRLQRKLQTTTIYVTHDQVEAMTMGDRIMVLKYGKIQQIGAPEILYNSPANMFVAQFIGSPAMNIFSGQMESGPDGIIITTELGRFDLPAERAARLRSDATAGNGPRKIMCGIRPEDVLLIHNGESDRPRGRVDLVESLGADANVSLVFDECMMLARTPADDRPREDDTVSLDFNMNKFHMFDAETEVNLLDADA